MTRTRKSALLTLWSVCVLTPLTESAQADSFNRMQYNAAVQEPNGLDICAAPLALGIVDSPTFDRSKWPAMCNTHLNYSGIQNRAEEIREDLASGRYSEEEIARMRNRELWIGAPRQAVLYVKGRTSNVRRVTTEAGVEETWFYRDPMEGATTELTLKDNILTKIVERWR